MRLEHLVILLSLFLIISCSDEREDFDTTVTSSVDTTICGLEYANGVKILNSSLMAIPFYTSTFRNYEDTNGFIHSYKTEDESAELWCLHELPCELDSTRMDSFWVKRTVKTKKFTSSTSDYQFKYSFYASLNYEAPLTYADQFYIQILIGQDHFYNISRYIIDARNDSTATNEEIVKQEFIEINQTIYRDVFIDRTEEFEVIYNLQYGIIHLVDLKNSMEFNLVE